MEVVLEEVPMKTANFLTRLERLPRGAWVVVLPGLWPYRTSSLQK